MTTKHEAIASAVHAHLQSQVTMDVMREEELPHEFPEGDALLNLTFETAKEVDRRLGTGIREWTRDGQIDVVVKGANSTSRITRLEAVLEELGNAVEAADLSDLKLDYLDLGAPADTDVIPMRGAENLRAVIVPFTLFYETSSNPMEIAS